MRPLKSFYFRTIFCVAVVFHCVALKADGLGDNDPTNVRQVPPPGIAVPENVRRELNKRLSQLKHSIKELAEDKTIDQRLLPDIEVFHRAVRTVLDNNEFFSEKEFDQAREVLDEGQNRAKQLAAGSAPWTKQTGLVVRGFRSRIDHTPQPYGLVIPAGGRPSPSRLDVWFHGRGERTSEVGFIYQRMHQVGRLAPQNTIVLHPYGRYSNAFKFAGETDVLEAIDDVERNYSIDPDRISVRGFSMGGAGCWQFAVHYADRWFAANPGAGFSETPEFLRFFQKETLNPTWYEQKLWQWYDCDGYAMNLLHCPTVAYSGELDIQKQAADVMELALAKIDVDLVHIIGAKTKHTIDGVSKQEIEQRMYELARVGRDQLPRKIHFRTYSLKYNHMHWVSVDALKQHWEPATVKAELFTNNKIVCSTQNVDAISLRFPAGTFQDVQSPIQLELDGQNFSAQRPMSDRSFATSLIRESGDWKFGKLSTDLRKRSGLQGPIDDAFMDSFIFVKPNAASRNVKVGNWIEREFDHAVRHWRQQFRGDARVTSAAEIKEQDIATANLVLFGTPSSNPLLAKIVKQLPITWDDEGLAMGDKKFTSDHHVPILIYPNPLNPKRYVVLNSGFTYREYAYLNNARQVPMLPDWAVVDVNSAATSQYPGKIVAADFFGELWEVKKK